MYAAKSADIGRPSFRNSSESGSHLGPIGWLSTRAVDVTASIWMPACTTRYSGTSARTGYPFEVQVAHARSRDDPVGLPSSMHLLSAASQRRAEGLLIVKHILLDLGQDTAALRLHDEPHTLIPLLHLTQHRCTNLNCRVARRDGGGSNSPTTPGAADMPRRDQTECCI